MHTTLPGGVGGHLGSFAEGLNTLLTLTMLPLTSVLLLSSGLAGAEFRGDSSGRGELLRPLCLLLLTRALALVLLVVAFALFLLEWEWWLLVLTMLLLLLGRLRR